MLERYFVKPDTIDRIRSSWLGDPIERYVTWLTEQGYSGRSVCRRVPILLHFGAFAQAKGCLTWGDLPPVVEAFVSQWVNDHGKNCTTERALASVGTNTPTNSVYGTMPGCGIERRSIFHNDKQISPTNLDLCCL